MTQYLGTPLLDANVVLKQRLGHGDGVYDDHWAPRGREVIAVVLEKFLARWLREGGRRVSEHR